MVSPFFCSIDCFPLTAPAYLPHCTPQGTPEPAQRADPAAAHPDPLTAHHGQPCLERLGLLGRHGFDNAPKPSFFLLCFCIFSSSAHHFPLLCTNSIHFFSFIVSVLALISSIQIGRKQYELSKWQAEAQNKVELYLLTQPITLKSADGIQPDQSAPAIYIRNVGGNVIYLERYLLNGREYPLGKEVLPPMSVCEGYRYIYLPTDGTTHVSLQIYFEDWQKKQWTTKGVADWEDGIWKITYQPCVRCAEQLLTRKKQICKP